jgi:phenylacetate-CoA ligase
MIRDLVSQYFLIPIGKTYSKRNYWKAKSYQNFLEENQYWPLEELEYYQNAMLKEMIQHAHENVPYYRDLFRHEGISPSDVKGKEDLKIIPFLTKDILTRNLENLVAQNVKRSSLNLVSTGGTTGTPIRFYRDQSNEYKIDGNNWRFWKFCGYEQGNGIANLWGNEDDLLKSINLYGKLKSVMDNEIVLNFYDLSEKRLKEYVKLIKRKRPKYLRGFSSAVYTFMRYVKTNRLDIPLPKAVIITSDKIGDPERRELDDIFNRAVFNEYGCREFSIIGFECEKHEGVHVGMENVVIEIENPSDEDQYGEVVVTSLTNWGMPFIRYKLGDSSKFLSGQCQCGRGLPRLESIQGRIADFVVTKTEKLLYGDIFAHLFYGSRGIEQYEVVQKEIGKVVIYLEKNELFSEEEIKTFLSKLEELTNKDLDAEICIVPCIDKHRSGKRRSVISDISKQYLQ